MQLPFKSIDFHCVHYLFILQSAQCYFQFQRLFFSFSNEYVDKFNRKDGMQFNFVLNIFHYYYFCRFRFLFMYGKEYFCTLRSCSLFWSGISQNWLFLTLCFDFFLSLCIFRLFFFVGVFEMCIGNLSKPRNCISLKRSFFCVSFIPIKRSFVAFYGIRHHRTQICIPTNKIDSSYNS